MFILFFPFPFSLLKPTVFGLFLVTNSLPWCPPLQPSPHLTSLWKPSLSPCLSSVASPDHPQQQIIQYLCLITCYTSSPLSFQPPTHPLSPLQNIPALFLNLSSVHSSTTSPLSLSLYAPSPVTPPHVSSRLPRYHPPFSSSIPSSLFRFQTPFGWSIGLSLANDSEVVWTVVDSLLELQLPYIPLIHSSLHWLMERGVTGQPFIVEEAGTEKQINTGGTFGLILDSLFWSHCQ